MDNLPLIEIAELNKNIVVRDSFQDDLSIADLDGSSTAYEYENITYSAPMRLNALLMVLVLEGSAKICLDYIPYTIGVNSFVTIMPTHTIQLAYVSPDFKGRLVVASKSFLEGCNSPSQKGNTVSHYMQIRKNPCAIVEPDERVLLDNYIQFLRDKIKLRTHFFQKDVIQNVLVGFFLELGNIFASKTDQLTNTTLSRKEELFEQFLQLLFEHCKEKHVVTFYAEKLFITPQYLSLILKELTGKSANKWIDDALIVEAKILLKAPQATVQQVADVLHFSDQSTFGKFFKKHMGISPMEYRKS